MTLEKLQQLIAGYRRLNAAIDAAKNAGCIDIDGELFTAIHCAMDAHLEMIDADEWITWFVYENDCGASGMDAGFDDDVKPIRTAGDLLWLIRESERRSP